MPHSKATVDKYLKELVYEGFMTEKPTSAEDRFRPRYSITKKSKTFLAQNAKRLLIDSAEVLAMMDSEDVSGWRRVVEILRQQGFIGDVKIEAKGMKT